MKLYELTGQNAQLKELLEKEEITQEDFEENKEMLLELIKEKAENIVLVNNDFDLEIAKLKEFEKMIADKRKALEKKQENFKNYIMFNMEQLELSEIKTTVGKIQIKDYSKTTVNEEVLGTECYDVIYKVKTQKELKELGYERALVKSVSKGLYIK